jgi:hypothetical protein
VRDGLFGSFALDRYGDTTLRQVAVHRIEGGRVRYVTAIAPSGELLARK